VINGVWNNIVALSRLEAAARRSSGHPQRLQRHLSQGFDSEIGESSFIAASTSTEASSPSYLLFSDRKFWAFAENPSLFQRIFVGILAGLRAFFRACRSGKRSAAVVPSK